MYWNGEVFYSVVIFKTLTPYFLPLDANSMEFSTTTSHPVVIEMPEHNPGDMGGTMRLGLRETIFRHKDSVIGEWEE